MQNSQGTLKVLKAVPKDTDMVLRASTPSRAGGIRNPMAKSGEMGICSCKASYTVVPALQHGSNKSSS